MIRNIVKELRIFERNKEEIKILGIAITAKIPSELHKVSYNAIRRWIKKDRREIADCYGEKEEEFDSYR